jgi:hypothetical protein
MKEIEVDIHKYLIFMIRKISIVKMLTLSKEVYGFDAIPIKTSMAFFTEIGKESQNKCGITKDSEQPKKSSKKNKAGSSFEISI